MISGVIGYAVGYPIGESINLAEPITLVIGLYLLSSGSFAINQAQEWRADSNMARTAKRPLPSGSFAISQAYLIGAVLVIGGLFALLLLQPMSALLGLLTIILYNGLYTLYWKKKWAFGAVPGAIPGAMPVVIGYSVCYPQFLRMDLFYLFLVTFLWQMPHFWALAVRYKDDYTNGGFPVLPTQVGSERTLYHIGLYTFAYVGVALAAPLFVNAHVAYLVIIVPLALKVIFEFFKYFHSPEQKRWLPFFLWVNLSMLAFISVPVFDKWLFLFVD